MLNALRARQQSESIKEEKARKDKAAAERKKIADAAAIIVARKEFRVSLLRGCQEGIDYAVKNGRFKAMYHLFYGTDYRDSASAREAYENGTFKNQVDWIVGELRKSGYKVKIDVDIVEHQIYSEGPRDGETYYRYHPAIFIEW